MKEYISTPEAIVSGIVMFIIGIIIGMEITTIL